MQDSNGFFIQFLRLAGWFWCDGNSGVKTRGLAFVLLTVAQIAIAVMITEWSAHLFNALDQRSMGGFFKQIGFIVLIFIANIVITSKHLKIKRSLQIDWRAWLTERLIGRWMVAGRHYLVTHIDGEHNNPDSRIAEDIRIATESAIELCHSLLYSLLLLVSFTKILWTLSGVVVLDVGLFALPIYGHLVWLAFIYAGCASVLGWWIGRPLTVTTEAKQTAEANFRFNLVTAREHSQSIALIHGEANEQHRLHTSFAGIAAVWQQQTEAWAQIMMFTSGYSVLSMAFPVLVAAPRYILGSITLGALMQSAQSFQQTVSALSWPVDNMAKVAEWRASVERILGLVDALDALEQEIIRPDPNRIALEKAELPILTFEKLCISKFNGDALIACIDAEIRRGERVLIIGDATISAQLFKAIAGLWPWGHGRIVLPDDDPMFFMPPRPYLPTDTLRAAICYPAASTVFNPGAVEQALKLTGLDDLLSQLDTVDVWDKALARSDQQRLGLVRLLLYQPKWILLQEAFDSLDPEGEAQMFRLICSQLPGATLISISNQPTAGPFHQRRILL
jgi:putative ATP-binding cassette transporter